MVLDLKHSRRVVLRDSTGVYRIYTWRLKIRQKEHKFPDNEVISHLLIVEVHDDNLGVGHPSNVAEVAGPGGGHVPPPLSQVQQAAVRHTGTEIRSGLSCGENK